MKDTGKPTEQVDGKNKRFACVYEVAMTRMRRTEIDHKHLYLCFFRHSSLHSSVCRHKLLCTRIKGRNEKREDSVNASRKKAICYLLCNSRVKQIMNHLLYS